MAIAPTTGVTSSFYTVNGASVRNSPAHDKLTMTLAPPLSVGKRQMWIMKNRPTRTVVRASVNSDIWLVEPALAESKDLRDDAF